MPIAMHEHELSCSHMHTMSVIWMWVCVCVYVCVIICIIHWIYHHRTTATQEGFDTRVLWQTGGDNACVYANAINAITLGFCLQDTHRIRCHLGIVSLSPLVSQAMWPHTRMAFPSLSPSARLFSRSHCNQVICNVVARCECTLPPCFSHSTSSVFCAALDSYIRFHLLFTCVHVCVWNFQFIHCRWFFLLNWGAHNRLQA